jgi:hypothetical protein
VFSVFSVVLNCYIVGVRSGSMPSARLYDNNVFLKNAAQWLYGSPATAFAFHILK